MESPYLNLINWSDRAHHKCIFRVFSPILFIISAQFPSFPSEQHGPRLRPHTAPSRSTGIIFSIYLSVDLWSLIFPGPRHRPFLRSHPTLFTVPSASAHHPQHLWSGKGGYRIRHCLRNYGLHVGEGTPSARCEWIIFRKILQTDGKIKTSFATARFFLQQQCVVFFRVVILRIRLFLRKTSTDNTVSITNFRLSFRMCQVFWRIR